MSKWCALDLFVSMDFGRTWQNLTAASNRKVASFWDFDWGANVRMGEHTVFPDETILATVRTSAPSDRSCGCKEHPASSALCPA
jgi:hypothetical protein